MQISCLLQINNKYDSFSTKELLIADFILKNPTKVLFYTIEDFATDVGVSEATVFRFIKKLGYQRYQYFKIALASEITKVPDNGTNKTDNIDKSSNSYKYIVNRYISNLEETSFNMDMNLLDNVVKTILVSKKIAFLGLGSSGELALSSYNKFIDTGLFCIYNADYHMQLKLTASLNCDDLAIVFCNSGMNKDTIALVSALKENGVPIVGLSSNPNSPFAKMVTKFIYTYPIKPQTVIEKLSSYISLMSVIDYLYLKILSDGKYIDVDLMNQNKTIQSRKYTLEQNE